MENFCHKLGRKNHLVDLDLDVDGRMTVILKKWDIRVCAGFNWLRKGSGNGPS
jgi:hypothetical protein